MRRRHTLAAVIGVLCLVVVGCGGSPEPKSLPKKSPSTSPSPSPSATPPVMPASAKQKTEAGARATVQYFVEALNFSGKAGDTSTLRTAFTETCTRCEAIADGID